MWPENWVVFEMFCALQTQWSVGMVGATGLRYEAAYPLIDRAAKTKEEWSEMFEDLRVLEMAALKQMSENRSDT